MIFKNTEQPKHQQNNPKTHNMDGLSLSYIVVFIDHSKYFKLKVRFNYLMFLRLLIVRDFIIKRIIIKLDHDNFK